MRNLLSSTVIFLCFSSATAFAENQTTDAALGGGVGGAIGGAIGAEIDGRNGAIIGAGVGAAIGAAVTTEDNKTSTVYGDDAHVDVHVDHSVGTRHGKGHHCPPGQAKKGRC